jgi:hypothetical protein
LSRSTGGSPTAPGVGRSPLRCPWGTLFALVLALACAGPVSAQTVRGRVVDAGTGEPMESVRVELLAARGSAVSSSVTDGDGGFVVGSRVAGSFRLRASHLGYAEVVVEVQLHEREEITVDLRLAVSALALTPLTVTARRRDPRHDASYEGMLARHELFPLVGSERVVRFDDPELAGAGRVTDVLQWMTPRQFNASAGNPERGPREGAGMGQTGRPLCAVVFWEGELVNDPTMAGLYLTDPMAVHLEAVEFYRYWAEAPMDYRQVPVYMFLDNIYNCSVVALWGRRTPVPPIDPQDAQFRARIGGAGGWQTTSGADAPGGAAASRAEALLYLTRTTAVGLHVRHAQAPMDPATFQRMSGEDPAQLGGRDYTVLVYGLEARRDLRRLGPVRPFVSGRLSLARRTFNPYRAGSDAAVVSTGRGAGITAGVERQLARGISVHAAVEHDVLAFRPFYALKTHAPATWQASSLHLGASLSVLRR